MNAVLERTNSKLGQMQNQVIVLETQLQFALELNKSLQEEVDKAKKKSAKEKNTDEFTSPN
jgi:hypothetical protein